MNKELLDEIKALYAINAGGGIVTSGKFEGESLATPYFYYCALDGGDWIMELEPDEKSEFNIEEDYVRVWENSQGFAYADYSNDRDELESAEYESLTQEAGIWEDDTD